MRLLTIVLVIVLILLLALVWGGVYVWPSALTALEPLHARVELTLLIIGLPLLLWGLFHTLRWWRRRQQRLARDQEYQYLRREKQRLQGNWKKLLSKLHQQPGGHNPYQLPWLIMLGDNHAGKSNWLRQAGFERTHDQDSQDPGLHSDDDISFWLSEHAVVLELAGHYLEESASELDAPVLQHLFTLLKQYRPRQPVSGVLVARAASQLVVHQPSWLQQQARQLRRRLRELDTMSGLSLPVWLQLTQCDQLDGFQACFNQSCSSERSQPLGIALREGYQPEAWKQGFAELQAQVTEKLVDLLHSEKNVEERQALTRFLLQLTLLQERLGLGFEELYANRHHAPRAWLAGVWFSSASQEGQSFNLLASEIARSWGFHSHRQQPQKLGNNSYFIRTFFPGIALPTLATVAENALARLLWQCRVAGSALLVILCLALGGWVLWQNVFANQQLQNLARLELVGYQDDINKLSSNTDLADIIPPLLRLKTLSDRFREPRPLFLDIGLFDQQQADHIHSIYQNQLQQRLFLPLVSRVRDTLAAFVHLGDREEIFRHLLYYLMMFDGQIRQPQDLNAYLSRILADREELPDGTENYLVPLLDDLWQSPLKQFESDSRLIAQARRELDLRIDNQLVYDYIRSQPAHAGKIDIRNLLGKNFAQVFRFAEGFDGYYLPVIFTREGYNRLNLLQESELIKDAVANLARVRGEGNSVTVAERTRISGKVRELYFLDYIRTWKNLIANIELRTAVDLHDQLSLVEELYREQNPALFDLIAAIADQTQLQPEGEDDGDDQTKKLLAKQAEKKAAKALGLKGASKKIAKSASRSALAKLEKQRSAAIVDEAFSAYASFYADRGAKLTEQLDLLHTELLSIVANPDTDQASYNSVVKLARGEGSSLPELQRLARQDRTAASVWLQQLSGQIWRHWLKGSGRFLEQQWSSSVWNSWHGRLHNRFPFAPSAARDARLGDFVAFLRPKGELDEFVSSWLSPFVVTAKENSNRGWQLRSINGSTLPLSPTLIEQLERADTIRTAFFSASGELDINYRMRAKRLDSTITSFSLRDGNGIFDYAHGPQQWQKRHWPQDPSDVLSLSFSNAGLQLARSNYSGPWGWQRFIADCRLWQNDTRLQLDYQRKSYKVTLELDLNQRTNPFNPKLLSEFLLPKTIINSAAGTAPAP